MDRELTIGAVPAAAESAVELPLAARIEHVNLLAAQVAVAEERARQAGQQAWQLGVRLGHSLCCLKDEVAHGEFKKLFKNCSKSLTCETFAFSYQSAARYMSLYREAAAWCKRRSLNMCGGILPADADIQADLSMRGAMQLFRTDSEGNYLRPAPTFSAPNKAGRTRKGADEVSEKERVAALAKAATEELCAIMQQLNEYMLSGRHTLAATEAREIARNVCTGALRKLKEVK